MDESLFFRLVDAMIKERNDFYCILMVLAVSLMLKPVSGMAAQNENAIDCDEGVIPEPVAVAYGDHMAGCEISPAVDQDQFTLGGSVNDHIRVNVLSTTTHMDPVLEVRSPNGTLVDTASCNNFGCSFSLDIILPETGAYLLALRDLEANEAGGYTMQVEKILPAPASPRLDYDSEMIDSISPATDVDHFHFNGTADTLIRLNALSTTTHMDPTIEVRDPNGEVVLDGVADGASCNNFGCSFSVDLAPTNSGVYSVLIFDAGTNEGGGYQLSLWCVQGDCDSDADGVADGAQEVIDYGDSTSKEISPAVDGDFYIFRGTSGDQVRLTALSTTTHMDPTIEVRGPNGTLLLDGAIDGASCDNFGCSFSVDLFPAISGTYSVLLYDAGTNEGGGYQFGLECVFSPGDFVCDNLGSLPIDLGGTIKTADDTDICAMVLASGKFMFSCDPIGVLSLTDLSREQDGTVKRQIYADGFFPKIDILNETTNEAVVLTRSGACPSYNSLIDPAVLPGSAGKSIDITGKVLLQNSQSPVCAMVLANGQYMFSCDGSGRYNLNIPLDTNGQYKLQVYADGFAPTIQIFDEFQTVNDVRMARATECQ
jgi:hypothetical protein